MLNFLVDRVVVGCYTIVTSVTQKYNHSETENQPTKNCDLTKINNSQH